MVLKNLFRRKGRTILTALAVSIGVAAIVALGAVAQGMKAGITSMTRGSEADIVLTQSGTLSVARASTAAPWDSRSFIASRFPPLIAISTAEQIGVDPRVAAIVVGLGVSNSFILPTHQVNALYMGPGAYRTKDYIKIGGLMGIIYIVILVAMTYAFYL